MCKILRRGASSTGLTTSALQYNNVGLVGQVGNAWTDTDIDNYGAIFYWWSHALISDATFKGISNEVIPFLPNCSIICTFSMPPVTSDMDFVVREISAALCTVVMEKVRAASEIIFQNLDIVMDIHMQEPS